MEKTTRARRNGNGTDGAAPISRETAEATSIESQETGQIDCRPPTRGLQDAFIDERNDVLAVITELEDQLDRHQEIRESMERELTRTAEQLQAASQRSQELEWQVVTLQTRVDALEQLRQDVAGLEEELNDANARNQQTREQLAESERERIQIKNELKAANKQLDELFAIRKERDGLRIDNRNLSAKVDELERTQREVIEERGLLQSQLQEMQITLEETTSERNQVQTQARAAQERIRELLQVHDALESKITGLRNDKKNLQIQITHLERENTRLLDQRQFYECELTSLRNQNRTAETALNSVKKAFSEVRTALTQTRTRAQRRAADAWPRIGTTMRGLAIPADEQGVTISTGSAQTTDAPAGEIDADDA